MPFRVQFTPDAANQLRGLRAADRAKIAEQCLRILGVNPCLEGRTRVKRLRGDVFPSYRLRVGEYRIFYDVEEASRTVLIYGIVTKAQANEWLASFSEEAGHEGDESQ